VREFACVVAADRRLGIGRGGDLPWRLPGDLAHFKRLTTETRDPARRNAVVMGRATWASIPDRYRPLPRRLNLVLSRRGVELPDGVLSASSLEDALERLSAGPLAAEIEAVFCVGGGNVYAQAIESPACRAIHLTRIEGDFDCDVFFPAFEHAYQLASTLDEAEENGVRYRIEHWTRR
jgi:dihydrofolate reductase / thymidylate synthase